MARPSKRVLQIGLLVLGIVLLVGVPAFLASRPSFYERSLPEKYEPWATSSHAEATCEDCHAAPGVLARTGYSASLVGEFYLSLAMPERAPRSFAEPTNEACLKCHDDLRSVSPKGDLQIPHKAHVNVLKMKCVDCHNYLVHEFNPSGQHSPAMSDCMTCHNGDRAKDTCTACHTEKGAPDSHKADDWLVVHAEKAEDPECDSCHEWTEDWCVDCHQRTPASHTGDWRQRHGAQVKQHRSCEACHEGSFCERCHGEVPEENLDPALKLVQ